MKIIVQKFGGTSTRSIETREHMYKNIIREHDKGNKVVAVVSAMGRYDDPYATDTLLSIVHTDQLTDEEIDALAERYGHKIDGSPVEKKEGPAAAQEQGTVLGANE